MLPLSRLVAAGLHPLLGLEGGLASRQLRRHPTRTSLTVGVLFVAVTVTITIGSGLLNNVRDIGDWYRRTIVGDYFVRGAMPDMGTLTTAALPERLAGEIAALPSVDRVDSFRFVQGTADGRPIVVLARTFAADRLGPADEVTLATRQGPQRLRVAGTVTEYTAGGSALYMEWGTAKRLLGIQGADLFMVAAKPGEVAALGTELKAMATQQGLLLQSLSELKAFIDSMSRGVLGILWLLMGMIFVVASLGIVNTLTMNVLEQTRELGFLRAVAVTRGQVRRMILAQALHVGVISLIPGVVAGAGMAFLSNRATYSLLGNRVEFRIDPMLIMGSFVVALGIAMAAAYLPARRAARLPVVEALQYE